MDRIDEENSPLLHHDAHSDNVNADQIITPIDRHKFFAILCVVISEPLCMTIFFPYIVYLIRDFNIASNENDIGLYAGFLAASFSLAQFITSLLWGYLSDKFGRKIIITVGLLGNIGLLIWFGFARDYWTALIIRAFTGALNGNVCVMKSVIAEITDDTNASMAFGYFNLVWSFGSIIGSIIGGICHHPADLYPSVFGSEFWRQNPYLLPPLVAATLTTVGLIVLLVVFKDGPPPQITAVDDTPQTSYHVHQIVQQSPALSSQLRNRRRYLSEYLAGKSPLVSNYSFQSVPMSRSSINQLADNLSFRDAVLTRSSGVDYKSVSQIFRRGDRQQTAYYQQEDFKSTYICVAAYVCLALANVMMDEVYVWWTVLEPSKGGLGFNPTHIAITLAVFALAEVLYQAFLYTRLEVRAGIVNYFKYSMFVCGPCVVLLPLINLLLKDAPVLKYPDGEFNHLNINSQLKVWASLLALGILRISAQQGNYTSINILVNNSASVSNAGFVNGLSQSCAALSRSIGPALAGVVWSWSLGNGQGYPLNYHFVFILICLFYILGGCVAFFMPQSLNRRTQQHLAGDDDDDLDSDRLSNYSGNDASNMETQGLYIRN
ncbi:hypothetical protein MIR68_008166 [Amoeboaphelidium protococcarum]|nr:hypothetical protein MIR68_008166 [Amoeboaphelidium protococcarum]